VEEPFGLPITGCVAIGYGEGEGKRMDISEKQRRQQFSFFHTQGS